MKKAILITGGAGFLGKKYCQFFLKKKFVVLCVDNDKKKIKNLNNLNLKNLHTYECDITFESEIKRLFKEINKSFFVNNLINNAAIDVVPFKKEKNNQKFPTSEMWDKEMNVSLKGSFLMIKYFGEKMAKKKQGSIINIGSDLSLIAPNQNIYKSSYGNYVKPVTYSVIKHGMLGMTKYFASLYGSKNVRVNMLSPGPIKNNQSPKLIKELKNLIPMNRLGKYEEMFGLLNFLSSDESSYLTGQNILVDGGRTII